MNDGGFTFTNFLVDVFAVFMFFVWLWLLVTVFGDLFRRHDVSGLGKVLWVVLLVASSLTSLRKVTACPNEMNRTPSRRRIGYVRSSASAPPTRLKSLVG